MRRRQSFRFAERTQCGGKNRCRALYGLWLGEAAGGGQAGFCDCKTAGAAGACGEVIKVFNANIFVKTIFIEYNGLKKLCVIYVNKKFLSRIFLKLFLL